MNKNEMSKAVQEQRASGKTLVGLSLFFVGAGGFFVVIRALLSQSFGEFFGRIFVYCIYALIVMSPTLLAASWQFVVHPCPLSSIVRWLGSIWLFIASWVMVAVVSICLIA